jgi:succinate dehydrogenase / fumarate reductase iron-sulfur subunit
MSLEVAVKVFRYKSGDAAPHYEDHRVSVPDESNVIDLIEAVWRKDDTFTFRHACHHASCGTCAVRVNGYERLPCIYPTVTALKERSQVLIEPLRNFPVVSDLVVDMGVFYQKMEAAQFCITRPVEPALSGRPYERAELFDASGQLHDHPYTRYENCIECGICISACPTMAADDRFLGPGPLAAVDRSRQESHDARDRSLLLALANGSQGIWRCHSAWECTESCPQSVNPAEAIMALRREQIGQTVRKLFGMGA